MRIATIEKEYRMLRILLGVAAAVAAILSLHHQLPKSQALTLEGTMDCSSGELVFSKGPLKGGHFRDVMSATNALRMKGYSADGLGQFAQVLAEACRGEILGFIHSPGALSEGYLISAAYPGSSSTANGTSVLRLEKNESVLSFAILNVDLKSQG